MNINYQDYIEIRVDKRFGKPCLKGTRISVGDVFNWLSDGMSEQKITADFEEVSQEMVRACLAFAADRGRKLTIAA